MLPSAAARAAFLRGTHPVEEMVDEILKDRGIELVHDLLAVALGENEPGVAQCAEVPRDGRPRGGEVLSDLAGGFGSVAKEVQDLAPRRIGERAEGVHGLNITYLANCASRKA